MISISFTQTSMNQTQFLWLKKASMFLLGSATVVGASSVMYVSNLRGDVAHPGDPVIGVTYRIFEHAIPMFCDISEDTYYTLYPTLGACNDALKEIEAASKMLVPAATPMPTPGVMTEPAITPTMLEAAASVGAGIVVPTTLVEADAASSAAAMAAAEAAWAERSKQIQQCADVGGTPACKSRLIPNQGTRAWCTDSEYDGFRCDCGLGAWLAVKTNEKTKQQTAYCRCGEGQALAMNAAGAKECMTPKQQCEKLPPGGPFGTWKVTFSSNLASGQTNAGTVEEGYCDRTPKMTSPSSAPGSFIQ